ncbi:MAG: hypothetical protein ABI251_09885 [Mycobacteriaceae bacterium]
MLFAIGLKLDVLPRMSADQKAGYGGTVAGVATYYDNFAELEECGIDAIIHLYEGAGESLADRAVQALGRAG